MPVLTPRLAPLDEKVLAALDDGPVRAGTVAALLFGEPYWECERCDHAEPDRMWSGGRRAWLKRRRAHICEKCWPPESIRAEDAALMLPLLIASPEDTRTVREVLRGLERIGAAYQAGGWWRRAA
jgi:hypothetical protein